MLLALFSGRNPPTNSMHRRCSQHQKQCIGKMFPAHVITNTHMCIVLQAKAPTAFAKNLCSLNIAFKVAHKCQQPCHWLHHTTGNLSQLRRTTCILLYSPMHCRYSSLLHHTTCTHFSKQHRGKQPPRPQSTRCTI